MVLLSIQEKSYFNILQVDAILITGILILFSFIGRANDMFIGGLTLVYMIIAIICFVISGAAATIISVGVKPMKNETKDDIKPFVNKIAKLAAGSLVVGLGMIGIASIGIAISSIQEILSNNSGP